MGSPVSWEGDKMFNVYIYDYCSKRGFKQTAQALLAEAELPPDSSPPINARQGLLFEWWSVFWVLFTAKSNYHMPHPQSVAEQTRNEDANLYNQHQAHLSSLRQRQSAIAPPRLNGAPRRQQPFVRPPSRSSPQGYMLHSHMMFQPPFLHQVENDFNRIPPHTVPALKAEIGFPLDKELTLEEKSRIVGHYFSKANPPHFPNSMSGPPPPPPQQQPIQNTPTPTNNAPTPTNVAASPSASGPPATPTTASASAARRRPPNTQPQPPTPTSSNAPRPATAPNPNSRANPSSAIPPRAGTKRTSAATVAAQEEDDKSRIRESLGQHSPGRTGNKRARNSPSGENAIRMGASATGSAQSIANAYSAANASAASANTGASPQDKKIKSEKGGMPPPPSPSTSKATPKSVENSPRTMGQQQQPLGAPSASSSMNPQQQQLHSNESLLSAPLNPPPAPQPPPNLNPSGGGGGGGPPSLATGGIPFDFPFGPTTSMADLAMGLESITNGTPSTGNNPTTGNPSDAFSPSNPFYPSTTSNGTGSSGFGGGIPVFGMSPFGAGPGGSGQPGSEDDMYSLLINDMPGPGGPGGALGDGGGPGGLMGTGPGDTFP